MEEQILKEILQEMKGMRSEQEATREEMKGMRAEQEGTREELKGIRAEQKGIRMELNGLQASVQVLTQGFSDVRYELVEIKKLLATRVIWNNDTVSFQVREGETLYGTIRKEEKKE